VVLSSPILTAPPHTAESPNRPPVLPCIGHWGGERVGWSRPAHAANAPGETLFRYAHVNSRLASCLLLKPLLRRSGAHHRCCTMEQLDIPSDERGLPIFCNGCVARITTPQSAESRDVSGQPSKLDGYGDEFQSGNCLQEQDDTAGDLGITRHSYHCANAFRHHQRWHMYRLLAALDP
jgi:hypothetical protein